MSQLGLAELSADSEDVYVDIAVRLASDPERLAQLRSTLRERMRASPLCDAKRIASEVEEAYRSMWRQHLKSAPAASHAPRPPVRIR